MHYNYNVGFEVKRRPVSEWPWGGAAFHGAVLCSASLLSIDYALKRLSRRGKHVKKKKGEKSKGDYCT